MLTEILFRGFSKIFMTFLFCLKNTATSLLCVITGAATWTTFLKINLADNFHCTTLMQRDKKGVNDCDRLTCWQSPHVYL